MLSKKRKLLSIVTSLALFSLHAEAKIQPFYPIYNESIPANPGVYPWLPSFTPDGENILYQDLLKGSLWITGKNGSETRCITCDHADAPKEVESGFNYLLDNKKVFISTRTLSPTGGSNDKTTFDAYILECAKDVRQCQQHKYLPVDMSADRENATPYPALLLQRRTWHIAPDGKHVAWMELRTDGSAMVIGTLERKSDRYVISDIKVVNPPGPDGANSAALDKEEYADQLWELKAFADGGKSILVVGEIGSNIDMLKVDLATGKTTRMTGNPDWDEDGALSPDNSMLVVHSWRTRHRLDAASAFPQLRNFMSLPEMANLFALYISSWEGFQCELSPWLLPATGDNNGKLIGQPLISYEGNLTAGNNIIGQPLWSRDSTRVLLQGKVRTPIPDGLAANASQQGLNDPRVLIAHIDRQPGQPEPVAVTRIGSWAPAIKEWSGPYSHDRTVTLQGKASGSVTIKRTGKLVASTTEITFTHFSDDGKTWLDGTMSGVMSLQPNVPRLKSDLVLSGENTGTMKVNIAKTGANSFSGEWKTVYNGKILPPLPEVKSCYEKMPQKTPLNVVLSHSANKTQVNVSATIDGDHRPVANAIVLEQGNQFKTDSEGNVNLAAKTGDAKRRITVTAGDTFVPTQVEE